MECCAANTDDTAILIDRNNAALAQLYVFVETLYNLYSYTY